VGDAPFPETAKVGEVLCDQVLWPALPFRSRICSLEVYRRETALIVAEHEVDLPGEEGHAVGLEYNR
jgi:hypothetical protein